MESASVRVDQWLWAIRLYKTRWAAQDGCRGGHVEVNGAAAKPATSVHVGDRVKGRRARLGTSDWRVTRLITKRVGAPVAVECYVDHSPPPPRAQLPVHACSRGPPGPGARDNRDRRRLDDLRKG